MDSTTPNNGSHQKSHNGPTFNHFFNGMQEYANFNTTPDDGQFDFMFDSNLYQNEDQPPVFTQHGNANEPSWNQSSLQQSADPNVHNYGSIQPPFQAQHYAQATFDNRHLAPQTYDPRTISRPSPSPSPYQNYAYQSQMSYGGRDPSLAPPQSFHQQQSLPQQRSPSIPTPTLPAQQPHNPYFAYNARQAQPPNLRNIDFANFSNFPDPTPRPAGHFIDPSFLTGSGLRGSAPSNAQHDQYDASHRIQPRQVHNMPTPTMDIPSHGLPQQQPPILQSRLAADLTASVQNGAPMSLKAVKAPAKPRKLKDPNAPKRPVGRPRKDGSLPRSKKDGRASASSSDSDSDDLEIEEMPEPKPNILNSGAPPDLEGKAIYDTAQAVWSPRNKPGVPDQIRAGIALFGETVQKLRNVWKTKNVTLQQAENANSTAIPSIKEEVARYRRLMELVTKQAVVLGHPAHLTKLGENPYTLSAFQSFLLDRFNASDFNGSLVTAILTLVTKFKTVDQDMLETAKMTKILVRLTKKANTEPKELAQIILDNATAATKTNMVSVKSEGPYSPASVNGTTNSARKVSPQPAGTVAGIKRPRDTEVAALPATKRTVVPATSKAFVQASKPLALQAAERKRLDAVAVANLKTSSSAANGASSVAPEKVKASIVVPSKPATSVFSSLMSASKKPGTSLAARQAAAKDKASSTTTVKKESPPPMSQVAVTKPSFSFMDTLADMNKPKEVEQKKVEDRPPETEEERRKRLRKEERRKLRVSWRPEESLTEVRIFRHDPEEEIGQTDSMMRDVTDVGGEGRMLKLHRDLDELDDEEEAQAQVTGEDLEEYTFPSEIDFTELDAESRSSNFIKFGGTAKPESPESEAQARREENTLMVVYSLPSDVPSTPKEPPAPSDDEEYTPETSFGEPGEKARSRESKYLAEQQARRPAPAPTLDLNALLQQMKQGQQPSQQQQAGLSNLEQTFGLFNQQPQAQQQPVAAGGLDLSKLLAVVNMRNQLQAQPQQQPQPQFPTAAPATQASAPNLAALLAQMQGQVGQQPPFQAMAGLPLGNLATGNPNPYPGPDTDYSRKHGRNDSALEDQDRAWAKKKKAGGGAGTASKNHPNFKTVVCKFWQEGKCLKGDDCTFRHDEG